LILAAGHEKAAGKGDKNRYNGSNYRSNEGSAGYCQETRVCKVPVGFKGKLPFHPAVKPFFQKTVDNDDENRRKEKDREPGRHGEGVSRAVVPSPAGDHGFASGL